MKPLCPPLRYFGSKWSLAPWLISLFPQHRSYVDVFAGSGAMIFRKPPSPIEVYNDVYGHVNNFMKQLRDHGRDLQQLLQLTPYSRLEFEECQEDMGSGNDLERARKFFLFANSGIQGGWGKYMTGFRTSISQNTAPQKSFCNNVDALLLASLRLRDVVIENRDFREVFEYYGKFNDAFLFLDPPYVKQTRTGKQRYNHEFEENDHLELLQLALATKASVMICGYDNPIYNEALAGWYTDEKEAYCTGQLDGNQVKRSEKIWCNYQPILKLL
jgi:DNA adenine methylase